MDRVCRVAVFLWGTLEDFHFFPPLTMAFGVDTVEHRFELPSLGFLALPCCWKENMSSGVLYPDLDLVESSCDFEPQALLGESSSLLLGRPSSSLWGSESLSRLATTSLNFIVRFCFNSCSNSSSFSLPLLSPYSSLWLPSLPDENQAASSRPVIPNVKQHLRCTSYFAKRDPFAAKTETSCDYHEFITWRAEFTIIPELDARWSCHQLSAHDLTEGSVLTVAKSCHIKRSGRIKDYTTTVTVAHGLEPTSIHPM